MRKQQRFSLHCLPGCGTIAVLRARKYNDENNSYDGGRARALYDTSTGAPPDFGNVCAHGYLDVRKLGAYWLWAGLPASVRHKLRRRQTHPRAAGVLLLHPPGLRAQCLTLVLTVWIILCTMLLQTIGMAWQASVVAAARQGLFLIPVVFILPNLLGLAGVEYAQPAADLLAFALALPMGLSVLKTFRSDAPTPAHTLREE